MSLTEELQRVRQYLTGETPPPANEANTCSWVIRPLLHRCGYAYHEIDEQGHDAAGGIPDFALLPHTPHTWFLEAKKWTETLNDNHVIQALNYAHAQGKRWVVLANGREWRLYDDHIIGVPPAERLVVTAKLNCDGQMEALLGALSRASLQAGELEKYVNHTRLTSLLHEQLQTQNSEVIAAIRNVLKGKFGLSSVTSADVVAYFHSISTGSAPVSPPVTVVSNLSSLPKTSIKPPLTVATGSLTLSEMLAAGNGIMGQNPETLTFPDATVKQISSWRDMTIGIVEWLFVQNKKPIVPFSGQKKGKRCLINTQPVHPSGAKMTNRKLVVNGQTYYVHTNRSGPDFVRCLHALCEAVGESPDGFRVTLK